MWDQNKVGHIQSQWKLIFMWGVDEFEKVL